MSTPAPHRRRDRGRVRLMALMLAIASFGGLLATAATPTPAAADTAFGAGTLRPGQEVRTRAGHHLVMQTDGNLVLYHAVPGSRAAAWASNTTGRPGTYLEVQGDGNAVLYQPVTGGRVAVWASGTAGRPGAYLVVQDDGNLVMYQPTGSSRVAVWSTNTHASNGGGGAMISPMATNAKVTSVVGDSRNGGQRPHAGIDLGAPAGTRTVAFCKLHVTNVLSEGSNGVTVAGWVETRQPGWRYWFAYRHLAQASVRPGTVVTKGATIGTLNHQRHLHFEFKRDNPRRFDGGQAWSDYAAIAQRDAMNASFPRNSTVAVGAAWGTGRFSPAPVC